MLFAATVALGAIAVAGAAPAGALVTSAGGTSVGVQPRISPAYTSGTSRATYANNEGNPVIHAQSTFVIYWDPTDHYHGDWQSVINKYFQNAGTASGSYGSGFAVAAQYTDKTNTPAFFNQNYKGSYTDTKAYPSSGCTDPEPFATADLIGPVVAGKHTPVCLTQEQVAAEVEAFVAGNKLPTGLGNTYFLLTPPAVTMCLDGGGAGGHCSDYLEGNETSYENSFCSFHGAVNPALPTGGPSTILYAAIPWSAGGHGDPLLQALDQARNGWECQDGGLDPTSKPAYKPEEAKEETTEEKEAFEKMTEEEKEEALAAKEREGPHEQQPNQTTCPTVFDGGCDTGLADPIISQIASEQVNMITDPLLNAWKDSNGNENTDECRFLFGLVTSGGVSAGEESDAGTLANQVLGANSYYLNDVFNLAGEQLPYPGASCLQHVNFRAEFTAPNPVNNGETIGFDGMESNITLNAATAFTAGGSPTQNYATYKWDFGDGTPPVTGFAPGAPACESPWLSPCAATVFHSYTYGGTYPVTLTVTDVARNVTSTTHLVTVVGPPPPSGSASGSGSGGSGSGSGAASTSTSTSTGSGSSGSGGSGGSTAAKAPVATAAVLSRSLRVALKHGVLLSYSVDQQVAGHIEVLMSRSLARRLHIQAPAATSLAAGSSPRVVVAKAFIRTTKGGRSKMTLLFTSKTARRLAHQRSLSLMLRLFVRNSANQSATVLSTFSLNH